jgi:hypothetical protein
MSEQGPERHEEDLTTKAIIEVLQNLANGGRVEFAEEDKEHVAAMEPDEAVSYLMFALAEIGEDPETFLSEHNIVLSWQPDEEAGSS